MIGLLWFDNTKKPLQAKIEEAVARYAEKFLAMPEVVEVNPADLEAVSLGKIAVRGRGISCGIMCWWGWRRRTPSPAFPQMQMQGERPNLGEGGRDEG